jgi:hypothetical protein
VTYAHEVVHEINISEEDLLIGVLSDVRAFLLGEPIRRLGERAVHGHGSREKQRNAKDRLHTGTDGRM